VATGSESEKKKLLSVLAEKLPDKVLKDIFPARSPGSVRDVLRGLAGNRSPLSPAPEQMTFQVVKKQSLAKRYILHTDGASRGNPGEAGAGACIFDSAGKEVFAECRYLGQCTNNVAEYQALLLGLKGARQIALRELEVRLDSELIARQLAGRYRVKDAKLQPLFAEAKALIASFASCKVTHVPRNQNARADELANQAIDQHHC